MNTAADALTLAGGEESDVETVFLFKNSSTKLIVVFSVVFDPDIVHSFDYLETNETLRPGALHRVVISARELARSGHIARILAVVFADGTAEGVQSAIDYIRSKRLGRMLETERIRNLFKQAGTGADRVSLATLLRDIGSLPNSTEEALSSVENIRLPEAEASSIRTADELAKATFVFGIRGVREDARWSIGEVMQLPEMPDSAAISEAARRFAELKAHYDKVAEKYRAVRNAR